jgi:dTMP kinase
LAQLLYNNGLYVVIEGIDGSGKSTLINNLFSHLVGTGHMIDTVKEPSFDMLKDYIKIDPFKSLLYAADRAHLITTVIKPKLEDGYMILSDRSYFSSIAYQGHTSRSMKIKDLGYLNRIAMQGVKPDIVIYLRISPEDAMKRIIKRGNPIDSCYENEEFLTRASKAYDRIFMHKIGIYTMCSADIIDATKCESEILREATKIIFNHPKFKPKEEDGNNS